MSQINLSLVQTRTARRLLTSSVAALGAAALGVCLAAAPLAAQTAPAPAMIEVSPEVFDLLEEWSTESATPERLAVDSHPAIVDAYVGRVEGLYGISLVEHFERNDPELALEYFDETASWPPADGSALFAYLVGADAARFEAWQSERDLVAAGLDFATWAAGNYPDLIVEVERENLTPAKRGVSILDYASGDTVIEPQIIGLLDKVGAYTSPSGGCGCWIVAEQSISISPTDWNDLVYDEHIYNANFTVVDIDHVHHAAGVVTDADLSHRRKWNKGEYKATADDQTSTLNVRMHCTKGGEPGGVQCVTPTCTGELSTAVKYGSRAWARLDAKSTGGGLAHAFDTATLVYNPNRPSEQLLLEMGTGAHIEKVVKSDPADFIKGVISLVKNIIVTVYTGDTQTLLDDLGDELLDELIEGAFKLAKKEGAEGTQMLYQGRRRDNAGTILPNETYTLELTTESVVRGRGWGPETKSQARIDSSYFIAAATRNFVCQPGVTAPQPTAWWRYGAAPDAPYSAADLRSDIESFVAVELGAGLPADAFDGDASHDAKGSFVP